MAALYAVVPEEHRQKKKMAKLCIQQYDDINLLPLNSHDAARGENESSMVTSVTIEGGGGEGYSRLCHAGPRMNQTSKYLHSSLSMSSPQLLNEASGRKDSRTGSVKIDKTYSEVEPVRPRSRLIIPSGITGGYSMIEQREEDSAGPPLPERINKPPQQTDGGLLQATMSMSEPQEVESSTASIPYQNMPAVTDGASEPVKFEAGYSMVAKPASPQFTTDGDFFGDVMEFHNLQAQERTPYERVN